MKNSYMLEYRRWLDSPALSEEEWMELDSISGDDKEIKSRFFAPLEFGTAGLRGTMAVGLNRMNTHVVRHATQAFAEVIRAEGESAMSQGVIICFDCRKNSPEFAREAASVMAGNGISVRMFDALRPTPELSFAIRHYGATAGINITASHNPKEYNGYKVYWSDGAQLPPRHADAVARKMGEIDIFGGISRADFVKAKEDGLITIIGEETDEVFLENVLAEAIDTETVKRAASKLRIVYTPFHGCGYKLVPEALKRLGVTQLVPVPEQMVIDGSFPTVKSPNPEEPAGFYLAVELAKETGGGLIIGTDPDSDRVGIMVRKPDGEYVPLTGNQTGVLLLDYVITARRRMGTLPENAAAIKTIVTTEMAREVAEKNGVHMDETFTGFKFMAEKVAEYEASGSFKYIFAFEESYGYMVGGFVRDKDAVTACVLIAEMAAYYADKGMTLWDAMEGLYEKYGCFRERTINLVMPGLDGLEKMKKLMKSLREEPPAEIAGVQVLRMRDYLSGRISVSSIGGVGTTPISGMDVLYYIMADGTSFIVRPSGTEPKIKVYVLARGDNADECEERVGRYVDYANSLMD